MTTTMNSSAEITRLHESFGERILKSVDFRGETTLWVELAAMHEILAYCRDSLGYAMLLDVVSVDHLDVHPRFEIIYQLATVDDARRLRVKAHVAEGQAVRSASDLWGGANWHEREVWDMMGIPFDGHPDLTRILMWEGYPFHPLRKDFPLAGRPSEMPDVAVTDRAPMEGGPFVTRPASDTVRREPRARTVD